MKKALFILFAFSTSFLAAQQSAYCDGMFYGNLLGIESTLHGQTTGANWNGTIDAGGYLFNLKGSTDGMNLNGTMSDPQTGGKPAI